MTLNAGMAVERGFGSAISNGASSILQAFKNAVAWTGRMVKVGFEKLGEAIKYVWNNSLPFLKNVFTQVANFLRTAPGIGLISGVLGTAFLATAEGVKDQKWVAIGLRVAAAAAFIGTGVAIGLGFAAGWTTRLI